MCSERQENACKNIKNPRASGALKWAPDPMLIRTCNFKNKNMYPTRPLAPYLNLLLIWHIMTKKKKKKKTG